MASPTGAVRALCRLLRGGRGAPPAQQHRRVIPVLVSVLALAGATIGLVLAAAGGKPGPASRLAGPGASAAASARTAGAAGQGPVVSVLGGSADGSAGPGDGTSPGRGAARNGAVPVAAAAARSARSPKVAPLGPLRQADLLVVAPFSLPSRVLAAVAGLPSVSHAEPVEAARIQIDGTYTAVLGVDPSTFRGYAARPTAASDSLWQGVADGGVALSYTMGTLDRISLGGQVTVSGHQRDKLLVVAFGTVGIGGVDAVVSDATARSLGVPADNAIVVSASPASVASLASRIKAMLPPGAADEALVSARAAQPPGVGPAAGYQNAGGTAAGGAGGAAMTATQLAAALRAAESRRGMPYLWGAAGPGSFDCSGLVQWSFAQAGVRMPRVAADQARTGPPVPVSQLEPGDLLFYHTDPTAPGYISHVAIYLGNGWMIQAPEPGADVEVVPADFGAQFAGAVRVDPRLAAEVAAGLA